MTRPQTVVERVEHLLADSAPDEIAVLLNISEAEVRRIAQLLDERGPADPKPLPVEDVQAVTAEVDALPEADDDPTPTRVQVKAAAVVIGRSTSGSDLDDLAGALGIRHAIEPAERWLDARDTTTLTREMAEAFTAVDAAVDALTPEHIAARLADVISSAETWGADGTQAPMSEPGDATTTTGHDAGCDCCTCDLDRTSIDPEPGWQHPNRDLEPSKPDTLAPTRPIRTALVEHVAALADYADGIAQDMTATLGLPDGFRLAFDTTPSSEDVRLVDVAVVAQPFHPAWTIQTVTPVEASEPEQIHKPSIVAEANANDWPPPGHVHDPFPVADEHGVFHAQCECGTRWDRASCDICSLPVTALVIAQTGLRRHKHHQAGS